MRTLCLALALCCVSYAAADLAAPGLDESEVTMSALGGRNYLVETVEHKVTVTTEPFSVTGIVATGADATLPVKGAFFLDETKDPHNPEKEFKEDEEDFTASVTWDQAQVTAVGPKEITYRVYTVEAGASPEDVVFATSAPLTVKTIDLKAEKPESVSIVRNGCNVEFNMVGIYSSPPMRTFCGLMEGGELLSNLTAVAHDEGVIAFDSSSTAKPGEDSKWAPKACTGADGKPVDDCAAWELTEGKLNVKETTAGAAIGAACMVWVDGQTAFMEYYGNQTIEVPAKHWCPTNPLKALAANLTDVKYQMLDSAPNCWTEEDSDIAAEMSCTGEGKMSNSFTVFCKDGAYMAYSGSKDKAEAYDEAKATAWADETCGTAGILPMTLLVGALALFASRA